MITSTAKLMQRLERLEGQLAEARSSQSADTLAQVRADRVALMRLAGLEPDAWQADLLRSSADRIIVLGCRQMGKSSASAALAVLTAIIEPGAPVLLLSPSLRQSGELFRKALEIYKAIGRPVRAVRETTHELELANGSRVISLPGTGDTIRGFSAVRLLVIDEASRVADELFRACTPMLAVSRGRLVALSTPCGQRGWFYDEWASSGAWERVRVTADQVPRISPEFLASERASMGDRFYRQEYECSFEAAVQSVFNPTDINAALADDVLPLFAGEGGDA